MPDDILQHISPDEFQIPEPSIAASWDDETQHIYSQDAHELRHPSSACSKRSTSSRQSQPCGGARKHALALSSSSGSGARATPPELPPVAGRAMSLRGSLSREEGPSHSPGGLRYSFSPGSPEKILRAKISGAEFRTECNTPSKISCTPPLAHQVTFADVELPELTEDSSAKRRRQQAAYINKSGPPPPTATIRPVSANPAACELNAAMMVDACGVDMPREVEVRT